MAKSDLSGLTVLVNCAACHGLLAWSERQGFVYDHQLVGPARDGTYERSGNQYQTLLATTRWAVRCLGVNDQDQDFWRGWAEDRQQGTHTRSWKLGRLCRTAPAMLRQNARSLEPARQAAMYHCYEDLLLNPDQMRGEGVDGHVDDRSGDLELSEAVYRHNFRQPLRLLLDQLISKQMEAQTLTVIDVGAGSGGMLLDVAESILERKEKTVFVAFDPSSVSRESCLRKAQANRSIALHVADGSIEYPDQIAETLRIRDIQSENCIVLAKAALHDRRLSHRIRHTISERGTRQNEVETLLTADDYVYRDVDWKRVDRQQVIEDMIMTLNRWRQVLPSAKLVILESHLLPTQTITGQIERIALMPTYVSHSLSAQYLLSGDDHQKATQQTDYTRHHFLPIQLMPERSALMSVTLLED